MRLAASSNVIHDAGAQSQQSLHAGCLGPVYCLIKQARTAVTVLELSDVTVGDTVAGAELATWRLIYHTTTRSSRPFFFYFSKAKSTNDARRLYSAHRCIVFSLGGQCPMQSLQARPQHVTRGRELHFAELAPALPHNS